MRILFLYPNVNLAPRINHGIAALSAFMKKHGHTTGLIQFDTPKSLQNLGKISDFRPDIIAISSCTNQWEIAKSLAEQIKRKHDIKIFAGGAHPTVFPECLLETAAFDGICRGEGELSLLELVDRLSGGRPIDDIPNFWMRSGGITVKNEMHPLVENLDELPTSDWSIFDINTIHDYPCFSFSRGCAYGCGHCINSTLRSLYKGKGAYIRVKSVKRAIAEIKDKMAKYDLKVLNFDDDSFIKNEKWISDFCSDYQRDISIPFNFNTRPENINEGICSKIRKAGGRLVAIGIESGDPTIRSGILNRFMTDDAIVRAFRIAREAGLKTCSFNMVGIPGETPESFKKTIRLNRIVSPDMVQLSIFYPYPRTPLGELCLKRDYIKYKPTDGYFHRSVLKLPEFPQREICRWYDRFEYLVFKDVNFVKAVKWRISKFMNRHRILKPVYDMFILWLKKSIFFKERILTWVG